MFRIAVVQMSSTDNLERNLARMKKWVAEAAALKAQFVVFPEMAYYTGPAEGWKPLLADYPDLVDTFAGWAREYAIHLLPGSLREPVRFSPGTTGARYFNTLLMFDPSGTLLAKYRKLFLFKANLPDRRYDESESCEPGNHVVTCDRGLACFGFGICYDLRFPETFRALRRRGAQVVILPSAFTVPTGEAHWEPLLRARAIENQFFVVAPAMTGKVGEGKLTYGHSLVVSPWGEVIKDMGTAEGLSISDLDLGAIATAQAKVNAWASIREELFPFG